MTPGKVSIVILNWNQWAITAQCLNSLSMLDYPDFEVILVDNASDSPPPAEITSIIPDTVLIRNSANFGFGKGNNPGIRRAMGNGSEFVWLLNNDTEVMADTLSLLVSKISESPGIGAAGTEILSFDNETVLAWGGGKVNMRRFYTCNLHAASPGEMPDYLTAASMLLRSEALKQTGLFDERFFMYWEDIDLCFRLKQHGWTLAVAGEAKILHMEGSSSESIVKAYYEFHSVIYFASKYARHYIPAVCWIVFDRIIKRLAMLKFIWLFKFIVISFRYKRQVI
ncbi:MAG: glycosyltransferase family 2 protein [Lentisphaerota bacterium]